MKKIKKYLPATLLVLVLLVVVTFTATTVLAKRDDNTIYEGVSIASVDVGGMTKEEAQKALDEYAKELSQKTVTVLVNTGSVELTLGELGVATQEEEVLEEAFNIGKTGNFIKRIQQLRRLEGKTFTLELPATVDRAKVKTAVETKCTAYEVPAENATLTRENGVFVVTDHKTGIAVSVEETTDAIVTAIEENINGEIPQIEAVVETSEPQVTRENAELCKDVLGTYSTTYTSSSESRANNLANGAKKIDGTVILPGETFSTGGALSPITVENGYSMAGAYQNGQVVDSIGGGVCQVATTLYNAALLSEIEIAERSNHSMIVSYVKPSMDAAIAGDYKDLKLTNDTDAPLYIEATTVGRTITFTIYGHETRDLVNRKVEYESKVLSTIQPGEKVTEDPTKPEGYRQVTQSAHVGYTAELWKVVYENGVEVSRERVNSSTYAASPTYVTIGTKVEEEETEETEETDTEKESDKKTDKTTDKKTDTDKTKDTENKKDTDKSDKKEETSTTTEEPSDSTEEATE